MNSDQQITISYNDRAATYSFTPDGAERAIEAITGPVNFGAWGHAMRIAYDAKQPITIGELAIEITAANDRLTAALAKRNIRRVKCDCGHTCESNLVMSASLGSSCPKCYDRLSN